MTGAARPLSASELAGTSGLAAGNPLKWWLRDSVEMVKRNLRHVRRTPELLLDVTIQPVMFVLLFRYVFGGAIPIQGTTYVNYLMAGIFVQTIVFAAMGTGILLATDLAKGMIDRFRSLPMSQSAVITGRTFTDLLRGMLAIALMALVGLLVGFQPAGSPIGWVAATALLLLFGFAVSWVGVAAGALVRTPEAVQGLMFVAVFPLTFASSAFVPTSTMPSWLRFFAEHQPMTLVINGVRGFILGRPDSGAVIGSAAWSIGLVAVFFPLALVLYRRRTSR